MCAMFVWGRVCALLGEKDERVKEWKKVKWKEWKNEWKWNERSESVKEGMRVKDERKDDRVKEWKKVKWKKEWKDERMKKEWRMDEGERWKRMKRWKNVKFVGVCDVRMREGVCIVRRERWKSERMKESEMKGV